MYEVDARGLSCPEPVMLTQAALKSHGNDTVKVLVTEPHSKANVEKFARSQGKTVTVTETGDGFELMRQKEWKLIITFHTTSDAIAFEKACKETGRSGRMIPVPRELSAGCGLAWCTVPADRADMETFLKECSIECEDMAELLY